ncbi:MAG: hypothetical protein HYX63_14215 [Gammaproteobacteria bacterium]|nr:hypothetical protein [Gammaproteobacteria bacterium]
MSRHSLGVTLAVLFLSACGADPNPSAKKTIDVTPANAHNIVTDTGAKVNAEIEASKDAVDHALDEQTGTKSP